jgi:NADH-quinone oxidoreductase subunit F
MGDKSRVELYELKAKMTEKSPAATTDEVWDTQPRVEVPTLPVSSRKTSFNEIELSFDEQRAQQEARRCLRCDLEK